MPVLIRKLNENENRFHAREQLVKGLKNKNNLDEGVEELRMFAAIANALIYVGDNLKELNDNMKENEYIDMHGERV
jgi:hypothetical protein